MNYTFFNVILILKCPGMIFTNSYLDILNLRSNLISSKSVSPTLNQDWKLSLFCDFNVCILNQISIQNVFVTVMKNTVVLVTFSSETAETSNRYPGVIITPFVNLKKVTFGRFESNDVIEWIFGSRRFFLIRIPARIYHKSTKIVLSSIHLMCRVWYRK